MNVKIEIDGIKLEYDLKIKNNGYWSPLIISAITPCVIEVIEPLAFDTPPEFKMIVEEQEWKNIDSENSIRIVKKAKLYKD